MFIKSVIAKNFGIHKDAEISLQDGLIVVRGRNGQGKSTLGIQAPLYAFFGASTLESTLEDTVTRGEPVASLKVEVEYGPYLVKRSKGSASVTGNGIEISGQGEVSNFFYDLFGLRKGNETRVLVSEQGKTVGILGGKPGEVNSFIEGLAGFDQIDDLILKVQEKFPSGQKKVLEDRLSELNTKLEDLNTEDIPDTTSFKKRISEMEETHESLVVSIKGREEEDTALQDKILACTTHNLKVKETSERLEEVKTKKKALVTQLNDIDKESFPAYAPEDLDKAKELLSNLDDRNREWKAYTWLSSLEETDEWDEGTESFKEELARVAKRVKEISSATSEIIGDIKVKRSSVITDTTCSMCHQDVTHLHKDINKKLQKEIAELETEYVKATTELKQDQEYLVVLNDLNTEHLRRIKKATLDYLDVDEKYVPHRYKWKGQVPSEPDSAAVQKANQLISDNARTGEKVKAWKLRHKTVTENIISLEEEELDLTIKAQELGPILEVKSFQLKQEDVRVEIAGLRSYMERNTEEISEEKLKLNSAENYIHEHQRRVKETKEDIANTNNLVKTDTRNGLILKSVRDAKPEVLESVWGKILQAVSGTFSGIVGRESEVIRTSKGFRINDLPVSRLSGSEKTTLGIALRMTLRDIFAPTCGFLIFDEPFADMDEERTAAVTAVIKNIPGQVLVITHEENTEMLADQFIEVGV